MKKFAYQLLSLVSFLALAQSVPAFAATTTSTKLCPAGFTGLCNINANNAGGAVGTFIQLLLVIAVIVSLFFLIWGGVRYIMSGGDKGKIDSARGTVIAAIVGLIISLAAFFIVNVILTVFTGNGISGMTIPKLTQ